MEAHDYKIQYKDSKDGDPHVKYVHALNSSTAEEMFRQYWVRSHGDDNSALDEGSTASYSCKITDVSVLRDGHWSHDGLQ
jgi:hypothetical protein